MELVKLSITLIKNLIKLLEIHDNIFKNHMAHGRETYIMGVENNLSNQERI